MIEFDAVSTIGDTMVANALNVLFVIVGIMGFFTFYVGRNASFKKVWFPRYNALLGILFGAYLLAYTAGSSDSRQVWGVLLTVVPVIGLISWMTIKLTKFCDRCGTTNYNSNFLSPMNFCPRCGASFDTKPKHHDNFLE